jgi:hypothetical protein
MRRDLFLECLRIIAALNKLGRLASHRGAISPRRTYASLARCREAIYIEPHTPHVRAYSTPGNPMVSAGMHPDVRFALFPMDWALARRGSAENV